jgi:S1-C subfamily serine protease
VSSDDESRLGDEWLLPGGPTTAGTAAPYEPTGPEPGRPRRLRVMAGGLALVLAGGLGGAAVTYELWSGTATESAATSPGQTVPAQPQAPLTDPFGGGGSGTGSSSGPSDAASIATKVEAGIVDITTTLGYEGGQAAGTGMVLTSDGEILTNNHVIAGATSISVTDVGDGKTYAATVVGYDTTHDIAVLQLKNASGLTTIEPASEPVAVGAGVVGVGNGGGSGGEPEYAGGVVTALDQTITASDESDGSSEQLTGLIETNAAIVAGYSGGPLVTQQGEVVGVDTAASSSARFRATAEEAYAIPIARALRVAARIQAGDDTGTVHIGATAMLGVSVSAGDRQFASSAAGAVVSSVLADGPSADAGLEAGDVITEVGNRTVTTVDDIAAALRHLSPGTTVAVAYVDGSGTSHTVPIRLVAGPAQ